MMSEFPNNAQSEHLIIDGAGDGAGDYSSDGPAPCTSPRLCHFLPESKKSGAIEPPTGEAGEPGIHVGSPASWNQPGGSCRRPLDPQPGVTLPSGSNGPQCDGGWDLTVLESKDWADPAPPNIGSVLSSFQ